MHAIEEMPGNGEIVIRPMIMALSYDHRVVDGKEAVTLLSCKEAIEEPARLAPGI